jgi:NADH dehydrogenase
MGRYAGHNAVCDLLSRPLRPYRQPRYVTCLDLGTSGAVFTTGWQREVSMVGAEAKHLKQSINGQRIYPPHGDRAALLAAAEIDPPAIKTDSPT